MVPVFYANDVEFVRLEESSVEMNVTNPSEFILLKYYPNPFNSSTSISYDLNELMNVEVAVFDLNGQRIAVLEQGERTAGTYNLTWNAVGLSAGVYYVKLITPQIKRTSKVTLIK